MSLADEVQKDFEYNDQRVGKLFDIYVEQINVFLSEFKTPKGMPEHIRKQYDHLQEKLQLAKKLVFKDPELTPRAPQVIARSNSFNYHRFKKAING